MRMLRKEDVTLSGSAPGLRSSTSNMNSWDPKLREQGAKTYGSSSRTSEPSKHLSSGELGLNLVHTELRGIEGGVLADFSFTPLTSSPIIGRLMHSLQSRSAMNLRLQLLTDECHSG